LPWVSLTCLLSPFSLETHREIYSGDATATAYAPTAQAASQQGKYLARVFNQMAKQRKLKEAIDDTRKSGAENVNAKTEELAKQVRF
jgi:NADH:ubiquinone reductase (non-electrogenic)